jgi:hypothetical protein
MEQSSHIKNIKKMWKSVFLGIPLMYNRKNETTGKKIYPRSKKK